MSANEQDVVLAFRQELEEQLRRAQESGVSPGASFKAGEPLADSVHKLIEGHEKLEREVALLRTIILKLISEPVDGVTTN